MMEKFVDELHKQLSFKDTTRPGDIVILASDEPRMIIYALVTGIERDSSRKDQWWHVIMQVLSVPPQEVIWTLRAEQFTGKEIFTFSGVKHFMKAVSFDSGTSATPEPEKKGKKGTKSSANRLRVIK